MVGGAVQRARGYATPRVLAFYKLIEARAWARDGNARAADAALAASENLLSSADARTGDDPTWIDFFDERRLAADAVEIQRDHALKWNTHVTMPTDTFARSYAICQAVLGSAYAQGYLPDLEQALEHGHRAVTALTVVNSARAVDYVTELLSRLSRWNTEPGVIELAHRAQTEVLVA
jgi:hypothetical protein